MGGRHSSTQQGPFVWSVVAWLLPWVLIAAVAGVAVSIAVDALGRDALDTPPPAATGTQSPSPALTPSPTPAPTRPTTSPSKAPEKQVDLISEGITVQVLNATTSSSADDVMADRLASLGFEVISVDSASGSYERTTVFWSYPDARAAGEALARRFGWVAREKPANLSATVALHVVVGLDEA